MTAGWSMATASQVHAARIDDELGFAYRLSGLTLLVGTALALRWNRPADLAQTLGYAAIAIGGLLCSTVFLRATRDLRGG